METAEHEEADRALRANNGDYFHALGFVVNMVCEVLLKYINVIFTTATTITTKTTTTTTTITFLNEDITKCLNTYCNTNLYVSTTVFITQGNM